MGKLGDILSHPDEIQPLVQMALAVRRATKLPSDEGLAFCYDILNKVSRSFAVVIQQLPNPLRDAICVFYLVLRGLDTVEDDMAIPDHIKVPALLSFHDKIFKRGFTMDCGTKHYKHLMAHFNIVVDVFLRLDRPFQDAIADITKRMGAGMAKFIQKEVVTVAEYDEYCHYVAGLVGIGLSNLFASSGMESESFHDMEELSNHMGLFLQKTNIIRDYLEDIMEEPAPRMFWPQQVWGRYAGELADLKEPSNRTAAVQCLNHLVTDALRHLPHCLSYMAAVQHPMNFRFCAIPQIMAMGTLALCYNNGKLFEGVVKMRRGQTAKIFASCSDMEDLYTWLLLFLRTMQRKCDTEVAGADPSLKETHRAVLSAIVACEQGLKTIEKSGSSKRSGSSTLGTVLVLLLNMLLLLLASVLFYQSWQLGAPEQHAAQLIPVDMGKGLSAVLLLGALYRAMWPSIS